MKYILAQADSAQAVEKSISEVNSWVEQSQQWLMSGGLTFGTNLLGALIVYLVGKWLAHLVQKLIKKMLGVRGIDKTLADYTASIAYALIMIMVLITALGKLGVPTAQFAAIIAAGGLAIGLALQGNLANFASGFMLIFFRPVKVGDYITAGGAEGTVTEIGIFTTTLNTLDNKKVIVPNSAITGGNIVNFSANELRLVCVAVSVSPTNQPCDVEAALLAAAEANTVIVKHPAPAAVVTLLGEGKMTMELRAWCKSSQYWDSLFSLNRDVKASIESSKVIPFLPHQAVHVVQD